MHLYSIKRNKTRNQARCNQASSEAESGMKNNTLYWLYCVPGRKKLYILALILTQALNGASGVVYALFLRGIVDAAASGDRAGFWRYILMTAALILIQLGIRAVLRWLNELSKSSFENLFKGWLVDMLLLKDYLLRSYQRILRKHILMLLSAKNG